MAAVWAFQSKLFSTQLRNILWITSLITALQFCTRCNTDCDIVDQLLYLPIYLWSIPGSFVTGNLSQCPTLTLRREKYVYGEIFPEIHNGKVLSVDENYMQVGLFHIRKGKKVVIQLITISYKTGQRQQTSWAGLPIYFANHNFLFFR